METRKTSRLLCEGVSTERQHISASGGQQPQASMAFWLLGQALGYHSGVGVAGPVAGGLFAAAQTCFGPVAAGGVMATIQSAAMGGVGAATVAKVMAVTTAATTALTAAALTVPEPEECVCGWVWNSKACNPCRRGWFWNEGDCC